MKRTKKFLLAILAMLTVFFCGFAVACEQKDNQSGTSNGITFKTLSVEGTDVYGEVSNATETFSFINEVAVQGDAKFIVALDVYGIEKVSTKTIALSVGDNKVYVIETLYDEPKSVYEVVIRRRTMCEVVFVTNGGTELESQMVEEDGFASEPQQPTRTGYTFSGWDYDFSTPITEDTTINANWTAKTDTAYKVEYYLQNLENSGFSLIAEETENLTGATGATVNAEIKEFAHFTRDRTDMETGVIKPDGSTVLKVFYTRNTYTVTFNGNGGTLVSGWISQTVKYGGSAFAPTFAKSGHSFSGFDKPLTNISENVMITAQWQSVKYTITYYAVIDGGQPTAISADMKVENGQYPVEYIKGTGAIFSDLQDTATYDFQGWYIDAACTAGNEFDKVISATDTGNKSFYAKFVTITQNPPSQEPETPPAPQTFTITYKVVVNGVLQTDTTVFDELKGTATYPVEYTYGTGATVSNLNDKDEYDFEGWFLNEACTTGHEFAGTISATDSGVKNLYAKVTTKAKIMYVLILDDGKPQIFVDMERFMDDGKQYPTEYAYNTTTTVDDLKNYGSYEFGGWYLDEDCETEFDGTIDATNTSQRGTLTLYAKIIDLNNNKYWTPSY